MLQADVMPELPSAEKNLRKTTASKRYKPQPPTSSSSPSAIP